MSIVVQARIVPEYRDSDWPATTPPVIRQILAARGVLTAKAFDRTLQGLIPWTQLGSIGKAATIICQAIREDWWITVAGDYDCDGATGTSVAILGLKMLGAKKIKFVVPNRFKHGYGLSAALVDDMDDRTQLIITVDSGTSSHEGIARAHELGRKVVVTDHHLPAATLPPAEAIVNPNLDGDPFPSKMLAGVGVMFYVLLAVRAVQRMEDHPERKEPELTSLLDLVALGTIADLVPLDTNNRILVNAGLRRIRAGKLGMGLRKLMEKANKDPRHCTATDFGFAIAPRLNAAGRMEDMTVGIMALTAEDPQVADDYVQMLEDINNQRKERQQEMILEAETLVTSTEGTAEYGVTVFDPTWHSGIVGLVASRLKESLWRPVIALAPAEEGSTELRGSCRSIPGFHLRDALALVDARNPQLMKKFGGHAMAAGLSMDIAKVDVFKEQFDAVAQELLTEDMLNAVIQIDGELPAGHLTLEFAQLLIETGPWGQAFPEPMFQNVFEVVSWRTLGQEGKHLKLTLRDERDGSEVDGIMFSSPMTQDIPTHLRVTYSIDINIWRDRRSLQLMIRHLEGI